MREDRARKSVVHVCERSARVLRIANVFHIRHALGRFSGKSKNASSPSQPPLHSLRRSVFRRGDP